MISEAEVLALLAEWRAEIDSAPTPELVTTEAALDIIAEQGSSRAGSP